MNANAKPVKITILVSRMTNTFLKILIKMYTLTCEMKICMIFKLYFVLFFIMDTCMSVVIIFAVWLGDTSATKISLTFIWLCGSSGSASCGWRLG